MERGITGFEHFSRDESTQYGPIPILPVFNLSDGQFHLWTVVPAMD